MSRTQRDQDRQRTYRDEQQRQSRRDGRHEHTRYGQGEERQQLRFRDREREDRRDTRKTADEQRHREDRDEQGIKVKSSTKQYKSKCHLLNEHDDYSADSADSGEPIDLNFSNNVCGMLGKIGKNKTHYNIDVVIDNVKITMSIDTCSDLSLITLHDYKNKFNGIQLLKTKQKFKTYGGQELKLLGKIIVNPVVNGVSYTSLTLYVADVNVVQPPLFGCNWLQVIRVDWSKFKS
jgi:hypothetical protein